MGRGCPLVVGWRGASAPQLRLGLLGWSGRSCPRSGSGSDDRSRLVRSPQRVHSQVPEEASVPAGTGLAIPCDVARLLRLSLIHI